jgi:hypothetical protein
MTATTASFVSATSVMLAAYGFFFSNSHDRLDEAARVGSPSPDPTTWAVQVSIVTKARKIARLLATVPLAAWAILAPEVYDQLKAVWAVRFDFGRYATLEVVLFALINSWLAIAAFVALRARTFTKKIKQLKAAPPPATP